MSEEPSPSPTNGRTQVEGLEYLLSLYPIRESVQSASHRSAIRNLAQTSHILRTIFTHSVPRLTNPFPTCSERWLCALCNTPICVGCSEEVVEVMGSAVLLSYSGYTYTVVSEGKHAFMAATVQAYARGARRLGRGEQGMFREHGYHHRLMCQFCAPTHRQNVGKVLSDKRPDWVGHTIYNAYDATHRFDPTKGLAIAGELVWEEIPRADSNCTCPEFNPACEASVHLVRVASAPGGGWLSPFAWLPQRLHQGTKDRTSDHTCILWIPQGLPAMTPQYHGVLGPSF